MNWKLNLAYDGTDFHGWQVQPSHLTIQGELAGAIERITGERVLPQGSGRTDAGVHARAQIASFELNAPIPPENLHRALNRTLPAAIRVLSAEHAPPGFHARHSVRAKTYEYRIFQTELCPPWSARYVYALNWPLNIDRMQQAAALVIGEHDFTSFAATDPDLSTRAPAPEAGDPLDPDAKAGNIRTIYSSSFTPEAGRAPRLPRPRQRISPPHGAQSGRNVHRCRAAPHCGRRHHSHPGPTRPIRCRIHRPRPRLVSGQRRVLTRHLAHLREVPCLNDQSLLR